MVSRIGLALTLVCIFSSQAQAQEPPAVSRLPLVNDLPKDPDRKTGQYTGVLRCHRERVGSDGRPFKTLELVIATDFGTGKDPKTVARQCIDGVDYKRGMLNVVGWKCPRQADDAHCTDVRYWQWAMQETKKQRRLASTYLHQKDVLKRDTVTIFLNSGDMMPICETFKKSVKELSGTGTCVAAIR